MGAPQPIYWSTRPIIIYGLLKKKAHLKIKLKTQCFVNSHRKPMLLGCVGLSKNSHQGRQNRFQVCVAHRLNRNNSVLQDACSVKLPFLSTDSCFFCLCEGHRNGLEVSQTVSSLLHEFLLKEIQARHSSFGMKSCFENAYKRMDEYLSNCFSLDLIRI